MIETFPQIDKKGASAVKNIESKPSPNLNDPSGVTRAEHPVLRWIQYIIFGSLILYFGRDVLIPLSFALLISFLLYPVCMWLEKKGTNRLTAIIISLSLLLIVGLLLVTLLINQIFVFINELPSLQLKLTQSMQVLSQILVDFFGLSKEQQLKILSRFSEQSGGNLFLIIQNALSASATSLVMLIVIPVYSLLILYYRKYWMKILFRLFPTEKKEHLREILSMAIQSYYNFIKGVAVVYLIVGFLNSIGLWILGIPHAFLFGFIASILTFIPYIGIIIGSLLPITMAWITYDSLWYPLSIVAIFSFVQYLEANIIFPFAVSKKLNVNMLVMLLVIFTGGMFWGIAGMILFVPFVGIAKLIADHNPHWKTLSMILGIENENQIENENK